MLTKFEDLPKKRTQKASKICVIYSKNLQDWSYLQTFTDICQACQQVSYDAIVCPKSSQKGTFNLSYKFILFIDYSVQLFNN